jgi:protein dithiol:quinone oxidoreductase
MINFSSRWHYFLLFFICHELLVAAYYFEYVLYLEPCPLCMISRLMVFSIGICSLLATLQLPKGMTQKIYHGLLAIFSGLGIATSAWHIYMQGLPADEVPACGPGLSHMLETMPLGEVLNNVLQGSGSCAEVSWEFIGLSMPSWMLIIYIGFFGLALIPFFKRRTGMSFKGA